MNLNDALIAHCLIVISLIDGVKEFGNTFLMEIKYDFHLKIYVNFQRYKTKSKTLNYF